MPDSPVVKIVAANAGAQVQSLVRELRSNMLCSPVQNSFFKEKKIRRTFMDGGVGKL